jgi:uncharacterized protein
MQHKQYRSLDELPGPESMQEVFEGTIPMARELANHGHAMAQYATGEAYFRGLGAPKDSWQAAEWCRKAAEQGHAAAQSALGTIYLKAQGVEGALAQALSWLQKAVQQGDPIALYALGKMYAEGMGVTINHKRAFQLFRRRSKTFRSSICGGSSILGGLGHGNERRASPRVISQRRRTGGIAMSVRIGHMYALGDGVVTDRKEALEWLIKSGT